MKIWLDDLREAPEGYVWVKNYEKFYYFLTQSAAKIEHISFDHDLGDNVPTGYDCAKLIEIGAYEGSIPRLTWNIHSANPSGEKNIRLALEQAENFWNTLD